MLKRVLTLMTILSVFCAPTVFARTVVNGIDANYPPFAYVDKNGNPAGFDVDAMNWIAEEMGFEVEHKPMEWSTIVQSVVARKIDTVMSGMTITDERKKQVNFSIPYWTVENVFVVREDSDLTAEQIMASKGRVGYQAGTSDGKWLAEANEKEGWGLELRQYDSAPQIVTEIINGRIIAGGMNMSPAQDAIDKKKPVKIAGTFGIREDFGVAMRYEEKELEKLINDGLRKLMADPYWEELKAKHIKDKK
ncbi:ABC transporter substrate-binding protein [Desulfopila inferna]|uniref:ABC transporter substrate-binding protein n=1 Tax=Desulfopila inferna TaxID=468528 RepID=UPI001962D5C7|nr:ABC transporter substrate-binding protein [Desulfopila inferna]MBM9604867.1 amino acid ABC transporter substrate-binding protein [Desulfopila inferna]